MQQQEDPIDQTKIKIKEGIEFALELIKKLSKSLAEQQREHYEIIKSLQINISITQIIEQDHQQAADIYNKTFDKDFGKTLARKRPLTATQPHAFGLTTLLKLLQLKHT